MRLGNTSVMVMLHSGEHPWVNMQLTRYFRGRKLLIRAGDFTSQAMSAPTLHQLTTDLKNKKKLLASNNEKPSITPGYPGTINLTLSVSVTVLLTSCIMLHRVQKRLESWPMSCACTCAVLVPRQSKSCLWGWTRSPEVQCCLPT